MIEEYNLESINTAPYTSLLVNPDIPLHTHVFWEFCYSVSGTIINYINGKAIECSALSRIMLIKPGDTHKLERSDKTSLSLPQHHRDIYVKSDKMEKICNFINKNLYHELVTAPTIAIDTPNESFIALEYTLNLFNSYAISFSNHMEYLEELHTTIVFQLLGLLLKNRINTKEPYPQWIIDFLRNLKNENFLCRNIEDIVAEIPYSHEYICRQFKKHLGKTMVHCLNESRINYSTILLLDKNSTILDIAMRLNYSSQSAYINAFKVFYNMSPSKWRQQILSSMPPAADGYNL